LVLVFEGQAELYYGDNDLNFMSWAPSKGIKV